MKKFLAIYTGSPNSQNSKAWDGLTEDQRGERVKAGMDAWGQWGHKNKAAIVYEGGPLGKTKKTSNDGVTDIKNSMAAYVIVQAASHEDAARIFLDHPHFKIFPGDAVEIMECIDIPKGP